LVTGFDLKKISNEAIPVVEHHASRNEWMDLGSNIFLRFNVWRQDIDLSFNENRLAANTRLFYWAEGIKNTRIHLGECGSSDGPRRIDVSMTVEVTYDVPLLLSQELGLPGSPAALDLVLVPTSGQVIIPDLRWVMGGACLIGFLGVGWLRATRKKRS